MPSFRHPPIRRHSSLAPFSRDHHIGLAHANRLIKSAGADRAARHQALAGFLDAWEKDIRPHFDDEEQLLLPLLRLADRNRLMAEHEALSLLAREAKMLRSDVDPEPGKLTELGRSLLAHIRWEERELFNHLQEEVDAGTLAELSHSTARIDAARGRYALHLAGSDG